MHTISEIEQLKWKLTTSSVGEAMEQLQLSDITITWGNSLAASH